MSFYKFHIKAILKNKYTYIPFIVGVLIISVSLFLNNSTNQNDGLMANYTRQIKDSKENNKLLEIEYTEPSNSTQDKTNISDTIEYNKKRIEQQESVINNFQKDDWKSAYEILIEITKEDKSIMSSDSSIPPELLKAVSRDMLFYQYLLNNNIEYDNLFFPTKAFNFTIWCYENIFPLMVVIFIVFILTQLYSKMFYKKINIYSLLPQPKIENTILILSFSIFISLLLGLFFTCFAFLLSGFIFGFGTGDFPVQFSDIDTHEIYFNSLKSITIPSIALNILTIVFSTLSVFLIHYIFRNQSTTLFISLLSLVAPFLLVTTIQPIQKIAHIIPMTYFNSIGVSTGITAETLLNSNVNIYTGILTNLIGIGIVFIGILMARYKLK